MSKRENIKQLSKIILQITLYTVGFLVSNLIAYYIVIPTIEVLHPLGKVPIYRDLVAFGGTNMLAICIMVMCTPSNFK